MSLLDDGTNVLGTREASQEAPEPAPVPDPAPEPEPAAEDDSAPSFADEVADSTVDEVMAKVEAGEWDAAEVYVAEQDGKGRTTLLSALEAHDEGEV
jgi:hypothetical protein